ncbi:MAG: NIF family HAD-type phosphatase [Bdellovibrionales bacterium]
MKRALLILISLALTSTAQASSKSKKKKKEKEAQAAKQETPLTAKPETMDKLWTEACEQYLAIWTDNMFGSKAKETKSSKVSEYKPSGASKPPKPPEPLSPLGPDPTNLDLVMREHKLTRLEAADLRAEMRVSYSAAYSLVSDVKAGKGRSGLNAEKLTKYQAVIAIDVDGTLLDQRSAPNEGTTFSFNNKWGGRPIFVGMSPGWDWFFQQLRNRNLGIVLFSRNDDHLIQAIADTAKIGDKRLRHFVDGVLTDFHMSTQYSGGYGYGGGYSYGSAGYGYFKDLRILDESGQRVMIVDDDPKWIRADDHKRTVYVATFGSSRTKGLEDREVAFVQQWQLVLARIDQALAAAAQPGKTFADGIAEFSYSAEHETIEAINWIYDQAANSKEIRKSLDLSSRRIETLNRARLDSSFARELRKAYRRRHR